MVASSAVAQNASACSCLVPAAETGSIIGQLTRVQGNVQMSQAAGYADVKAGAVALQPGWQVLLCAKHGPDVALLLDAAFSAVIASLHNWEPGTAGGRRWGALALVRFAPPQYPLEGFVGVELLFSTTGRFLGQE